MSAPPSNSPSAPPSPRCFFFRVHHQPPPALAAPPSLHACALTSRAGARDAFVVHLPDIGAFTKAAVWIAEPKVNAVAGDAWFCDRIVLTQQNKTENVFTFVVGKACRPKAVIEARPSTSAMSPPVSPARASVSAVSSQSMNGAATTRSYGDGQGCTPPPSTRMHL